MLGGQGFHHPADVLFLAGLEPAGLLEGSFIGGHLRQGK
jgi:hypothetical protein